MEQRNLPNVTISLVLGVFSTLTCFIYRIIGMIVGVLYKPDHINNNEIEKITDKDYVFTIDYSECKEKLNFKLKKLCMSELFL